MGTTTQQPPTAVTAAAKRHSIQDLLQGPKLKAAIAMAIPRHLTPERFIRVALNATMRTPDLLECTQESFFKCLLDLSAMGLEPDGRRAHLIPRNKKIKEPGKKDRWIKECTLIVDYKGLAELVRRSGDVSYIHADVVYQGDEWSFAYGTDAHLKHKPSLSNDRKENAKLAFYSYVRLKDGSEDFLVFSPSDVDTVRAMSPAAASGPWVDHYDEMGKKTVFRSHSKWLPLSAEVRDAIDKDDEYTDGPTIDLSDSMKAAGDITNTLAQDALDKLNERLNEEGADADPASNTEESQPNKTEEPVQSQQPAGPVIVPKPQQEPTLFPVSGETDPKLSAPKGTSRRSFE